MPEEKKTPTSQTIPPGQAKQPGESAKEYAPGAPPTIPPGQVKKEPAPNQDLPQQDPTQQDITAEQQEQQPQQQDPQDPTTQDPTTQDPTTQDQTRLTDLELKEMNTLTATPHEDLTDEQKKRMSELQQRLPKNPAKLRSKQRP